MINNVLWKNKQNIWEYDLNGLITYIENISSDYSGKDELTKSIGVYRDFLDKIEIKHNIKINYNFNMCKTNPNFKAIYQDYDWCYQKYMTEGLNHAEMAIEAKCSKRVIEKWCSERHRLTQGFRKANKQMNNIQKDLVIGSLLGDGHIDKRETQPIFIVSHAENQKDYLFWKYELMKDFMNIPPSYYKETYHTFNTKEKYLCQPHYRISSRIHNCFIPYREMSKHDLINNLNEFSLSIFALDDGYRADSNWQVCLADIPINDRTFFIDIMESRFDLIGSIMNCDDRYMRFTADSSRKLDEIILQNIPHDLDIIKDKIINNNKIKKKQFRVWTKYKGEDILLTNFCNILNYNYKYIHSIFVKYKFKTGEEIITFINNNKKVE